MSPNTIRYLDSFIMAACLFATVLVPIGNQSMKYNLQNKFYTCVISVLGKSALQDVSQCLRILLIKLSKLFDPNWDMSNKSTINIDIKGKKLPCCISDHRRSRHAGMMQWLQVS